MTATIIVFVVVVVVVIIIIMRSLSISLFYYFMLRKIWRWRCIEQDRMVSESLQILLQRKKPKPALCNAM